MPIQGILFGIILLKQLSKAYRSPIENLFKSSLALIKGSILPKS